MQKIPPRLMPLLLALASGGLLAAASVFEHGLGLAPCEMCLWQRWPHWAVVVLGVVGLIWWRATRPILALMAIALAVSTGLGFWHFGVEMAILPGLTACGGGIDFGGTPGTVLDSLLAAPPIRCDIVAWSFLGLSLAGWNGVCSLILAIIATTFSIGSARQ